MKLSELTRVLPHGYFTRYAITVPPAHWHFLSCLSLIIYTVHKEILNPTVTQKLKRVSSLSCARVSPYATEEHVLWMKLLELCNERRMVPDRLT